MRTITIAKTLYGFFGVVFLLLGATVLLVRTGVLPDFAHNLVIDIAHGDPNTLHLIQEFGSLMVFAGLITLWFIRHYEQSTSYHWAMTTFWALFSIVHWLDVRSLRSVAGPLINTAPFALFAIVGFLRTRREARQ